MTSHYENLPVYRATYQLTLAFQRQCMPHLSRDVRYTIGQGLVKMLMNLLVLTYEINLTREKHPLLLRARKMTVEVKVTLRMLCDMHQIAQGMYRQLSTQAESISKQFTAWDNSLFGRQDSSGGGEGGR